MNKHISTETIEQRFEIMYDDAKQFLFKTREPIVQTTYLVNGELRDAGTTERITTPLSVEGTYGHAPAMTKEESLAVLASSKEAWNEGTGEWPSRSITERVATIRAFVEDIKSIREDVVTDLMFEISKNKTDAEKEFDRTVEYIEKTCDEALQLIPDRKEWSGGLRTESEPGPLGITLSMSPYNYPLNETFTTFIPSLVMGNPTILKPARHGVLFRRHFFPFFQKHFPVGVVNTIYGDGKTIVTPIMQSGEIETLAFIGSDKVFEDIISQHPKHHYINRVFGGGAKNAYIVTKTADIDLAIKECLIGAFSYDGQRCTAPKQLYLAREIKDVFMSGFKEAVENIKIGMHEAWYTTVLSDTVYAGRTCTPMITPFPEPGKVAALKAYIQDALDKGATIVNKDGGKAFHNLMVPAVLDGVTSDMRIYHEEQFGSVLPVVVFDDIQEPIDRIKQSPFGQQTSIYCGEEDKETLHYFVKQVRRKLGRVNINCPSQRGPDEVAFSATKGSAIKTLSIRDSLLAFSDADVTAEMPVNGKYIYS